MNFIQMLQFVIGSLAVAGVATIAKLDYSIGFKTKSKTKDNKK